MVLLPPTAQTPSSVLASLPTNTTHYLVFFSSPEERGRPWCRDCRNAEGPISQYIKEGESTVVFVGNRDEWIDPANPWRQAPFNVKRIPTLIKLSPGDVGTTSIEDKVASAPKLVEADILEGSLLRSFLAL